MFRRTLATVLVASALLAACGGDDETDDGAASAADEFDQVYSDAEAYPVLVSNELVVGRNRFVVGLLDAQDAPLADPNIEMTIDFFDISGAEPERLSSERMQWVWIEEGARGYYVGNVNLPRAGELGIEIALRGGGIDEELRAKAEVSAESTTPDYGEKPPPTDTPTLADVDDVKDLSTDTTPVRRFYKYSIAEAVARGKPSVVVFATPKFCQSAVCAPTLDKVQEVARDFPTPSFVHVEPYELDQLPEKLVPVPAMTEWRLPSEPWVFVMDADGRIVAKFEGVMSAAELRHALRTNAS